MHRTGYHIGPDWSQKVAREQKKVMEWSENNGMQILLIVPMNKISQIYISSNKVFSSPFSAWIHVNIRADRPVAMACKAVFSRTLTVSSRGSIVGSWSSKKRKKNVRFNNKWVCALAVAMRVSFLIKNLIRLLCMVISFFFDANKACAWRCCQYVGTWKCNQSEFFSRCSFYPLASKK